MRIQKLGRTRPSLNLISGLKPKVILSKRFSYTALFVLPFVAPLAMPALTASAAVNTTEYPMSSPYTDAEQMVTSSSGSMWYVERSGGSYNDELGNITTSGTITNYSAIPSGYTDINIYGIAADSSGNIWFSACSTTGGNVAFGELNGSTGVVTIHGTSYGSCGISGYEPGPIAVDSLGNIWVAIQASEYNSDVIAQYSSSGSLINTYSTGISSDDFSYMSFGPDNTLWAAGNGAIDKFTSHRMR
jgi:streptogramin lyase